MARLVGLNKKKGINVHMEPVLVMSFLQGANVFISLVYSFPLYTVIASSPTLVI